MTSGASGASGEQAAQPLTIEFRCGDLFPADSALARWVICVAAILNDALRDAQAAIDARTNGDRLYQLRIAMGHLREAATFFAETIDIEEVAAFISSLSAEDQVAVNEIAALRTEDDHPLNGPLRVIRNGVFHYPRLGKAADADRFRSALEATAELRTTISAGARFGSVRAEVADEVVLRVDFGDIDEDALLAVLDQAKNATLSLQRVGESILHKYLEPRLDGASG